jgi:hypothetical protein
MTNIPKQAEGWLGRDFKPFYCSGDPHEDFSIKRWNEEHKKACAAGVKDKVILPGDYNCAEQCERCLNIVLDRKLKKFPKAQ